MNQAASNTVVSAFSEAQVARLTGLSERQLRYWDRTDFFVPSLAYRDRRAIHSRVYTFADVLNLQVLGSLRNDLGCSMPHLREVKKKLFDLGDDDWASTTLYVVKKRVVINSQGGLAEVVTGQGILNISLQTVRERMKDRLEMLRKRDDSQFGKVSQDRRIANNQPVIAGTRIPVRAIQAFAAEGYDEVGIMKEYPTLTAEDIRAAMRQPKVA